MTPTKFLIGQIVLVFAVVILTTWAATQWAAHMLGYQFGLGPAWFHLGGLPVYYPHRLYNWWYAYDAYAPEVFAKAGSLAAGGGFLGIITCVMTGRSILWPLRRHVPVKALAL